MSRIRIVLVLFVVLAFAPLVAIAQEASTQEAMPTGWPLVMAVAFLVLSVAANILQWVAPRTKNTIDDAAADAVSWVLGNRAKIEETVEQVRRYADPNDPSVPVAPTDPATPE